MNRILVFLSLTFFCNAINASALPSPEMLAPLTSKPLTGPWVGADLRDLSRKNIEAAAATKATVVAFLSAKCPCSESHEPTLKTLAEKYQPKGFRFLAIHSNADEDVTLSTQHFSAASLPFPVLQDQNSHWANTLGALKTPHAYVISPQGEILFQGGVDDSHTAQLAKKHFLADALEAIDQGKRIPLKEARALGCVISRKN